MTVPAFELARTTVTRAQFLEFAGQYPFPRVKGVPAKQAGNLPANEVSWWAAYLYCAWIGARLPSEAEWEYACRAGTTSAYSFGNDVSELKDHAWYFVNSGQRVLPEKTKWAVSKLDEPWGCRVHPVGEKKPNPWGLLDMHGNVLEWCQDKYRSTYEGAPVDGSALEDEASGYRVIRGGSFDYPAGRARSAYRGRGHPSYRWESLGFRPARFVTPD